LIILATDQIPDYVKDTQDDILAISTASIAALETNSITYKTFNSFVSKQVFYKKSIQFKADFLHWIKQSDKTIQEKYGEKVYAPNAFWLMHRLLNYFYIELITDKINKKYKKIHFVCSNVPNELKSMKIGLSNLTFQPSEQGLEGIVDMLYYCLDNSSFEILNQKSFKEHFYIEYFFSLLRRSANIIKRIFLKFFILNFNKIIKKKSNVAVLQSGYDVSFLIQENNNINFIDIKKILLKKFKKNNILNYKINGLIKKYNSVFFKKKFSKIGYKLSVSYAKQLSYYLLISPEITKQSRFIINNNKFNDVLCSIGVQNQIEYIFVKEALISKIKIHSFKHSGIESLFFQQGLLDSFLEKNHYPPRTQYLYSELEQKYFKGFKDVKTRVVGRLEPTVIQKEKNNDNKKIVYCLGPENFDSYKEMDRICHDKERFLFIKQLSNITSDFQNQLDIKIHPKGKYNQYVYLKTIQTNSLKSNFNILIEGTVDRIFNKYDLIVIDILHTRVFTTGLYLKIPMVVFIPETIDVDEINFNELQKKVYVVRNFFELSEIILELNNKDFKGKDNSNFNKIFLSSNKAKPLLEDILN